MPECTFFCTLCLHPLSLPPCIFSPPCPDERLGFFQGYPLSKYWTNSPTQSLCFPSCLPPPLFLFLSLYTAEQDKPQQGAGSWKSAEWRQPFLPSGGEKRFICPDPQNNFPRISRGEPAFSWITNRAFALGKEFTLTLSLYAFSPQIFRLLLESPTEFIANFWGEPLCGKKERRRSVQ